MSNSEISEKPKITEDDSDTATEIPEYGSDTDISDDGSDTEIPEYGSDTDISDDGSDTEIPEYGSDTDISDDGSETEYGLSDNDDESINAHNSTYISGEHGLKQNLSEHINNFEDIPELQIYLCIFHSVNNHPQYPYVKYIVKIENDTIIFPSFNYKPIFDGNSKIVNEVDLSLEEDFQNNCNIIVSEMSPKYEYRGIIPNGKEVFVFYEIEDAPNMKDGYLYAVIDELAIVGKVYNYNVSPIITKLFKNNQNLKYYYDESDFRTSPPHIGYKVDNMGIFKGQGTYYKVVGSGERFVFFTNNEKQLLDEDAINTFNENWMGEIVNDYDSICFTPFLI
jgi:hypothetical protein